MGRKERCNVQSRSKRESKKAKESASLRGKKKDTKRKRESAIKRDEEKREETL
jgi:hypothetical protein